MPIASFLGYCMWYRFSSRIYEYWYYIIRMIPNCTALDDVLLWIPHSFYSFAVSHRGTMSPNASHAVITVLSLGPFICRFRLVRISRTKTIHSSYCTNPIHRPRFLIRLMNGVSVFHIPMHLLLLFSSLSFLFDNEKSDEVCFLWILWAPFTHCPYVNSYFLDYRSIPRCP